MVESYVGNSQSNGPLSKEDKLIHFGKSCYNYYLQVHDIQLHLEDVYPDEIPDSIFIDIADLCLDYIKNSKDKLEVLINKFESAQNIRELIDVEDKCCQYGGKHILYATHDIVSQHVNRNANKSFEME